jgi:hypothetical protein
VYDLVEAQPDRIPTDLTYRPRATDLATVDTRFYGTTRYPSGEFRWDFRPYRTFSLGFPQRQDMPGTRTDYVSAQPGTTWAEDVLTGPDLQLESRSGMVTYQPGRRTTRNWFAPVAHPRNGSGFWWSDRQATYLEFNVQPWSDSGPDHGGYMQAGDDLQFSVYQDGTLVTTSSWPSASIYPAPTGPATYRLDLRASRDPAVYPLSPRTHTVWTVRSQPVTDPLAIELQPLLQLDYAVGTDLSGTIRGGPQTVGLTTSHLPGAVGTGAIVGATFAVSFDDGQTWHPVALSGRAGSWTARFPGPARGYVSLRAAAWDKAGNRITQEIIRAYALR